MTDAELLERVLQAAQATEEPSATELALLRAIVSTRDEGRRALIQQQAADRLGQMGDVALAVLRVVFAAVA